MKTPLVIALLAAGVWACASFGPKPFESDADYKKYVAGLQLSGLTGQAAATRAERDGFTCRAVAGVIQSAPDEIVMLCQRRAADYSCSQDQSLVLRLDWVGTPRPALAPGMRVNDVGSVAAPKVCE